MMNFFVLSTLFLAATVTAFSLAELQKLLPECSLVCLAQGVLEHNCQLGDFECQCSNVEPIIKTVSPCLVKAGCGLQNITVTGKVVLDVCKTLPDNGTATQVAASPTASVRSAGTRKRIGWEAVVGLAAMAVHAL